MGRFLVVVLSMTLIPGGTRSDERPAPVRVTGTVTLPKGETLPPGATVSVKIYFYRPSGMVTYYSVIGTHEFKHTDPNQPATFSVAIHKSYTEKYTPDQFLMKATVSVKDGKRTKTIYTTDDDDTVMPIDGNGKPKTNVKLRVTKNS